MAKRKINGTAEQLEPEKMPQTATLAPNFASYYTSETQVQVGPWDVRLCFGSLVIEEVDGKKTGTVVKVADVRMSPQHALKIVEILTEHLNIYQEKFGKLPMPPKKQDRGEA